MIITIMIIIVTIIITIKIIINKTISKAYASRNNEPGAEGKEINEPVVSM
jgi:hypothetical protein